MQVPWPNDPQARAVSALVDDLRVLCIYAPNARSVQHESFDYKLRWFERLGHYLESTRDAEQRLVICGDFNVAPENRDVDDLHLPLYRTFIHPAARRALQGLNSRGLVDVFRHHCDDDESFTWFDYRGEAFAENRGMRIDMILADGDLSRASTRSWIDTTPRGWDKPSDHTPIMAQFAG